MLNLPNKELWDCSIELEACIWLVTALDSFKLQGDTPEANMHGHSVNISNIYNFAWYDWVIFIDKPENYPVHYFELGHWLEPAIDVDNAMTYYILKVSREVVPCSSVFCLSREEDDLMVHSVLQNKFETQISYRLGLMAKPSDFPEVTLTPKYNYYKDGDEGIPDAAPASSPDWFWS